VNGKSATTHAGHCYVAELLAGRRRSRKAVGRPGGPSRNLSLSPPKMLTCQGRERQLVCDEDIPPRACILSSGIKYRSVTGEARCKCMQTFAPSLCRCTGKDYLKIIQRLSLSQSKGHGNLLPFTATWP
jgi:hypothetical protein